MSYADAIRFFENHLKTHWSATAIKWENISFTPTKDVNGNPNPYIAFVLRETDLPGGGDITLGSDNPWYRWTGIATTQIWVRENTGLGLALTYADQIKGLFNRTVAVVGATDIAVDTTDNSFRSVNTDFVTEGIIVGMQVNIFGFVNGANNGLFTVASVTAHKWTVTNPSPDFVTEAAGASITFRGQKTFSYGNSGGIRTRISSIRNAGITNGWLQFNVNTSYLRDAQS